MKDYSDIIDLPRKTSEHHARMPRESRAAQFAPFAAMVGHDAAIAEVGRLTERRRTLDEEAIRELDEKLRFLENFIRERPSASITYFKPDTKKEGGAYITVTGEVVSISPHGGTVTMSSGVTLPIDEISEITSPLFDEEY